MSEITTYEGHFASPDARFALVVGRFNSHIVKSLLEGAVDTLVRHGIRKENLTIVRVPGAFEIPVASQPTHPDQGPTCCTASMSAT